MIAITLTAFIILLSTLIVVGFIAFTGRAKGGAISLGEGRTQLARVLFGGFPAGIVAYDICHKWGLPWWLAPCVGVAAFISDIIGHSSVQGSTVKDYEGMSLVMTATLAITLLPFFAYFCFIHVEHWVWFFSTVFLGFLAGPSDWLGYKMKTTLKFFGVTWCVPNDTSWGELYRYAFALGLPLAILKLVGYAYFG